MSCVGACAGVAVCNYNHRLCETWNPCVWLIVCILSVYVWMKSDIWNGQHAITIYACVREQESMCAFVWMYVCESDSQQVNEHSLIGEPCRLKGRLIENASDTQPQPSLPRQNGPHNEIPQTSFSHTHTNRYKCYPVSCWGRIHAELHCQTRRVFWKKIKCVFTHAYCHTHKHTHRKVHKHWETNTHTYMYRIILTPASSISQRDTLSRCFFFSLPETSTLKGPWKYQQWQSCTDGLIICLGVCGDGYAYVSVNMKMNNFKIYFLQKPKKLWLTKNWI